MSAIVQKSPSANFGAAAPLFEMDILITATEVLGVLDFVDPHGYDGGTIGIGKTFANYVEGGAPGVAGTVLDNAGGAVNFDGGATNRMALPAPFALSGFAGKDAMVCVWVNIPAAGHVANTSLEMVIGTHASSGSNNQNMSVAADASGNVNDFYVRWGNTSVSGGNLSLNIGVAKAALICNGAWHQLVSRYLVSADGLSCKAMLYLDGALIAESAWQAIDVAATLRTAVECRLGVPTGGNRCMKGSVRRAWVGTPQAGLRTAEQIIDDDWQNNKVRLGAA